MIVDFSGRIDGVEFPGGQAKDFAIILGEGRMLPEFEAAVTGMQAGETKVFALTFPADYHGKEVAGKNAEFTLHGQIGGSTPIAARGRRRVRASAFGVGERRPRRPARPRSTPTSGSS